MKTLDTDLVIIGAGLAGICAAVTAQSKIRRILLLSKNELFASGSSFRNLNGRWGITYAVNDEEKERLLTTINTISKGTNNPALSQILVEESHQAFLRLRDWGVIFAHSPDHELLRVTPCFADIPLASIIQDTKQCAATLNRHLDHNIVTCLPHTQAISIDTVPNGFTSIIAKHQHNVFRIKARAAILATGGNGATFRQHMVDPGLTGDGYRILQELGVPLKNMEFPQMAWEDSDHDRAERFSLNIFFDENHIFSNSQGEIITLPIPDSALALARRRHIPISNLQDDRCYDDILLQNSVDKDGTPSPITVQKRGAAHPRHTILPHTMASNGGVEISEWGETGITGLLAAGEITTGMHGGDRVGGMMIASCLVFGHRAALQAIRFITG